MARASSSSHSHGASLLLQPLALWFLALLINDVKEVINDKKVRQSSTQEEIKKKKNSSLLFKQRQKKEL